MNSRVHVIITGVLFLFLRLYMFYQRNRLRNGDEITFPSRRTDLGQVCLI